MKKTVILIACACFSVAGMARQKNVIVKGNIPGLPANEWIYLSCLTGKGKDSIKPDAKGFKFSLHIPKGEGGMYALQFGNARPDSMTGKKIMFYLENGNFNISGKKPSLTGAVISGGKDANYFNAYHNKKTITGITELSQEIRVAFTNKDTAQYALKQQQYKEMDAALLTLEKNWYVKNASSPVIAYPLFLFLRFKLKNTEIDSLLQLAGAAAKNNQVVRMLEEKINTDNRIRIGKPAPDFSQKDTAREMVSLKDFRGKYVLIDFWASWCKPCRQENPQIVAAYHRYKDKGFTVLGVSFDRPDGYEKWLKAIHEDQLTWTHVSDLKDWKNEVGKIYGIHSLPSNVLVDPKGMIIGMNLRGEELHRKLKEILGE